MRLILGPVMSLALALGVAPAGARTTASPDPSAHAAFRAALMASFDTAWSEGGGTYVRRCAGVVSVTQLDRKSGTIRRTVDWGADSIGLDFAQVQRGRVRYSRTVAPVRASLRAHRAAVPPTWIRSVRSYSEPLKGETLWGDQDEPPYADSSQWAELTMAPAPGGGTIFTASPKGAGHVVFVTDSQGRLVSATPQADVVGETEASYTNPLACTQTWDWTRPHIAIPKSRTFSGTKRYTWEWIAVRKVRELVLEANRRLAASANEASVIEWLQSQVAPTQWRVHGIRFVQRRTAKPAQRWKPTIAFSVIVRDGHASYRPVR
ncbi:hypothetical protein [Nocardioides daeguensis]|uniref:Transposase n=1 Tax=Nocardioides daeguensis TaxID=908359 RepID=A0ABP6USX8_9ACTN|nr:hypothetical protein [Nocardioides daeguensis]MBV6728616.1 hypothetical protein [Nocardioides daeguensis]MCR1773775.1 hypothetical protein [Nocardioides daeguensis]